jgi:hypothetical protein
MFVSKIIDLSYEFESNYEFDGGFNRKFGLHAPELGKRKTRRRRDELRGGLHACFAIVRWRQSP